MAARHHGHAHVSPHTMTHSFDDDIAFVFAQQNTDGSFHHQSSMHTDFSDAQTYTSPFFTALIVECLCDVKEHPIAQQILKRAAIFLQSQLSENGTVNYWARSSSEATELPYPDDLDDTMLTLAAIYHYDPSTMPTEIISRLISLLTQLEEKPGGPYRTWVTQSDDLRWRDVDIAVNANIAYFLGQLGVTSRPLHKLLLGHIEQNQLTSPYYPSSWPVVFYLSRIKSPHVQRTLKKRIRTFLSLPTSPLDLTLMTLSMLHLNFPLSQIASTIDHLNEQNTYHQPYAFCFDPSLHGTPRYAGCAALTTALRVAAISRFHKLENARNNTSHRRAHEKRIFSLIQTECHEAPSLQPQLKQLNQDYASHRILLTAHDFVAALVHPPGYRTAIADSLDAANLFGWYAYTIFDDIGDEQKNTDKLPLAIFAQERCLKIFRTTFADKPDYIHYVEQIFQQMHLAMDFEMNELRFKPQEGTLIMPSELHTFPLEILAHRSFGHTLGPLGLFYLSEGKINSLSFQALVSFYKHFLITRQLLDDAHDWLDDFKRGQLTYISWHMLQTLHITHFTDDLPDQLHTYFWSTYFPELCKIMSSQARLCKRSFSKLTNLAHPDYFSGLLAPLEKQIMKSEQHYQRTRELIHTLDKAK